MAAITTSVIAVAAAKLESHYSPLSSHPISSSSSCSRTTQFNLLSKQYLSNYSPLSSTTLPYTTTTTTTKTRRTKLTTVRVISSLTDPHTLTSSLSLLSLLPSTPSLFQLADNGTGYSSASYYTSLGLFVISVPGLWSLIKRSVKSKIVKKTYIGEGDEVKKLPKQVAGEIFSYFTRNNFTVLDRGEAITFEGAMVPSRGQAALLTFCTCISLASVSLVLTITNPDLGNNWFWLTIFSPLAGAYYWKRASRKEQIKVKMIVAEDGTLSEIIVQGDDVQVEQMRKELKLTEKGMVYVKGIFERS